jgi:hypothetical protein
MQIAGSRCFVCGQNISVVRDGAGCVACQTVVHKNCISNQVCPKCEKPILTAERVQSTLDTISEKQLNRPTSVTVIGGLAFLGVVRAVFMTIAGLRLMANDMWAGVSAVAFAALQGIVALGLGLGLMNGHAWAPKLLLRGWPVAIAVDLALGDPGLRWPRFSVAVASYFIWVYFLTRPRAISFFKSGARNTIAA